MKKLTKVFLTAGTILSMLPFMVGCNNYQAECATNLNNDITTVLKVNNESYQGQTVEDFKIIGTDVAKTAFDFGVKFNGISELKNGDRAFTSVNYNVPSEYFVDLTKDSRLKDVYAVLDKIVHEIEYTNVTICPVNNLVETNDAFARNVPAPFKGYKVKDSIVYNMGEPVFNDEDCSVSFDVKTLLELSKYKSRPSWGIGIGFDAKVVFGYGIPINFTEAKGTFSTLDKYKFQVDKTVYDQMKQNPKMIYDYVKDSINNLNTTAFQAERLLTSDVTYDAVDVLSTWNMQDLNSELGK